MTIRIVEDLIVVIMMNKRIRMGLEVEVRIRGETISIISMIRTIQIREEEAEEKDLEEEASMGNVFTTVKKGIEHLNVPSAKEGKIEEQKAKPKLPMLMKMPDPHILKMLKEEKS